MRTITKLRLSILSCTDICSASLDAFVSSSQHNIAGLDIAVQEHPVMAFWCYVTTVPKPCHKLMHGLQYV